MKGGLRWSTVIPPGICSKYEKLNTYCYCPFVPFKVNGDGVGTLPFLRIGLFTWRCPVNIQRRSEIKI